MNVWVTGSAGMLGTALCRQLKNKGISFIDTDKGTDITCQATVDNFLKNNPTITHIVNCAGYTQVDKAEEETQLAHAINAIGPQNLGIGANKYGLHITHISTDYVFDGNSNTPYLEDSPCRPLGVYAQTKWEGEQKLLHACSEACIIRTSWLFGLNGKNFVSTMLQLMKDKEVLRVVVDQVGRPTFCDDLSDAIIALLNHKGIFHFANHGATSWHAFASSIADMGKKHHYPIKVKTILPISTIEYPTPAKRPLYSVLDTTKIKKTLKYHPRTWQEALSDYLLQYHKERR